MWTIGSTDQLTGVGARDANARKSDDEEEGRMDGWVGWFLAPFHINWSGLGVVGDVGLGDGEQDEELDGESFIEDGISSFLQRDTFS